MELQFYPPGFTPAWTDNISCSATKWCAAMTIDSLACTFNFATCNNNCIEPVNFAYLQTNGVPAGPPSPQLANVSTFTPNRHTLMFHSGDVLVASISDPPQGFTAVVRDLTTGQTGFMTASAANGFMNTNIADCSGTPFTFHAEYSTAKQQNQVPWAALEGGVLMQQEIGHGEVCNSVTNKAPGRQSAGSHRLHRPEVFDTCDGGSEGPNATGEGPCSATTSARTPRRKDPTARWPVRPTTRPAARSASSPTVTASRRERGSRSSTARRSGRYHGPPSATRNGPRTVTWTYDGQSYLPDWPNGSRNFPTTFQYIGPFTTGGHTYPQIQFETDAAGSENLCNTTTGAGCTAPPIGAKFYPFWSLSPLFGGLGGHSAVCVWNFGNDQPKTLQRLRQGCPVRHAQRGPVRRHAHQRRLA